MGHHAEEAAAAQPNAGLFSYDDYEVDACLNSLPNIWNDCAGNIQLTPCITPPHSMIFNQVSNCGFSKCLYSQFEWSSMHCSMFIFTVSSILYFKLRSLCMILLYPGQDTKLRRTRLVFLTTPKVPNHFFFSQSSVYWPMDQFSLLFY